MKVQPGTARRSQAERTAATRDALVATGRRLFAEHGYAEVATETIVRGAGVTRGALYHHFADKTELFAAVYEAVEADVTARIAASLEHLTGDPVAAMVAGARAWFAACSEPEVHRIVLVDGPAVLGWLRWREICQRYVLGLADGLLSAAMESGAIERQPVRPLAHVLIGAADEAALYVAQAADRDVARADMDAVIETLVRGMTSGQATSRRGRPARRRSSS